MRRESKAPYFPQRIHRPGRHNLYDHSRTSAIHEQLRRHRHLTLQLLWEEYREANPDGYRYSRYVAAKIMLRGRLSPLPGWRAARARRHISWKVTLRTYPRGPQYL
jgi:transposase